MKIGASFSHRHLNWLGHDPLAAIKEFDALGLKWIRLGCYWDEIEKEPGNFSFEELDPLLKFCEKKKINVVLTVGMKAPRYPEYYLPDWLSRKIKFRRLSTIKSNNSLILDPTLNYIKHTINHFKKSKAIKVWQVENEPLDPSGEKWWSISQDFLKEEVDLVRKLDPNRKILINLWGNELSKRGKYKKLINYADIVGFDIYLKHPIFIFFNFFSRYIGPLDSKSKIAKITEEIKSKSKEFWIVELQAEPWEAGELVATRKDPPSFRPKDFAKNLDYGKSLNPSVTLLWGFEWWYNRKLSGDLRYWDVAKRIISLG
jgi:hypothetical protein